jgi:hypothetical protein
MPISINGSGTITGVSVGGLPDGTVDTDMLADDAVTDAKEALSGTAKAWVNFDGTGTVAINASYNVSSITDNGTGDYTVNFTTAISDTNYTVFAGCITGDNLNINDAFGVKGNNSSSSITGPVLKSTTAVQLLKQGSDGTDRDDPDLSVAVFR